MDFVPQPAPTDPQDVPLEDTRRINCTVVEDAYGPYDRLPFEKTVFFYDEAGQIRHRSSMRAQMEVSKGRRVGSSTVRGDSFSKKWMRAGRIPDLRFMLEYDDAGRVSVQEQDSDGDSYPRCAS